MSYIVTRDNPYYPVVYYCDTIEQAIVKRDKLVTEIHEDSGAYEVKVVIAAVVEATPIRTHY